MVRSLWSAASGMIAQQTNVDTIANNLSNVNTVGYKTDTVEFRYLLYQTLQTNTTTANGDPKPIGAQVGLGVRTSAITSQFRQGPFQASDSLSAFAIEGKGFFAIAGEDGNTYYTRNGNFVYAINADGGISLTNSNGEAVLDSNGDPIEFGADIVTSNISISQDGQFMYPDGDGNPQNMGIQLGLFQFMNPAGLMKQGGTLFAQTPASGEAMNEQDNDELPQSRVVQGYLEASNVQVVDEMVNMIVAQRAYEMNSKAINTSDEMLQTANNLKR